MENNVQENKPVAEGQAKVVAGQPNNNSKMFLVGLAGLILLVLLVVVGLGVFRVYMLQSTDKMTVTVARILRLPIGKVNDKIILYTDYVNDLNAINNLATWQAGQGGGLYAEADKATLSDMVIEKLVGGEVINQAARDLGAEIDDTQVQALLDQNLQQFENEEAFIAEVRAMYGWSKDDYIKNAIRPTVLQYAIEDKVQGNTTFLQEVKQKMDGIFAELQAGADFSELAKKYNEDNTAVEGGDLGWFKEDEMDPQFAQVAFSLKPGETSSAPVESYYGLHLIKVEDRRTVDVTNEDGEVVKANEVKARHIFVAFPNASAYLRQKISDAQINLYGRIHNPFDESEVVASEDTASGTTATEGDVVETTEEQPVD